MTIGASMTIGESDVVEKLAYSWLEGGTERLRLSPQGVLNWYAGLANGRFGEQSAVDEAQFTSTV